MAVHTHLSDQQITATLDRYAIGPLVTAEPIETGIENSNYRLTTGCGGYVLTIFEKRADPKDLPYFAALLDHLAIQGMPVPPPIADRQGTRIQNIDGKAAWIVPFLEGASPDPPNTRHAQAAGRILAQLHAATSNFRRTRINALSLGEWHRIARTIAGRLNRIETDLRVLVEDELDFLDRHWPDGLPAATIHADLFPDNLLMTGSKVTGLIDFYFACTDYRAYDLAVAHTAWCFAEGGRGFDQEISAALIAGYCAHTELSDAERAALPVLCRGAALRFLLTRAVDWLDESPAAPSVRKNPLGYRERLAFYRAAPERLFAS